MSAAARRGILFWAVVVVVAIVGAAGVVYSTSWGIGLTPDSVMYIGGARGLIEGRGFAMRLSTETYRPVTSYMPGFPILIAAVSKTGVDPLTSSRWIEAALFGANLVLAAALLWRGTRRSIGWSILGLLLILLSPDLLRVHLYAWSEGLFLLLLLAGTLALSVHLERRSVLALVLAGLLLGASCLARYAGVSFVGAAILSLLILTKLNWSARLRDALIFAVPSAVPLIGWLLRNRIVATGAVGRPFAWHPISATHFRAAWYALSGWFVPMAGETPAWACLFAGGAAIVTFLVTFRQRSQPREGEERSSPALAKLLALFVIIYVAFLLVSICFFDFGAMPDARILSPALLCLLIATIALACRTLATKRAAITALLSALLVLYAIGAMTLSRSVREKGLGYASPAWRNSQTLAAATQIPRDSKIYTNAPDVLLLFQDRHAALLPLKWSGVSHIPRPEYESEMQQLADDVRNGAVIVLFRELSMRVNLPNERDLRATVALKRQVACDDGTVLVKAKKVNPSATAAHPTDAPAENSQE